jgi:hypothetical protein
MQRCSMLLHHQPSRIKPMLMRMWQLTSRLRISMRCDTTSNSATLRCTSRSRPATTARRGIYNRQSIVHHASSVTSRSNNSTNSSNRSTSLVVARTCCCCWRRRFAHRRIAYRWQSYHRLPIWPLYTLRCVVLHFTSHHSPNLLRGRWYSQAPTLCDSALRFG